MLRRFASILRFSADCKGSVAITVAVAALPMASLVGLAVDYGRAISYQTELKVALDAAVLAGASTSGSSQNTVATNIFNATASSSKLGTFSNPTFTANGLNFSGTVTGQAPTSISQLVGISSFTVGVSSEAEVQPINACILTLGKGMAASASAFTLNGAPNMNFSGCSIASNASMTCNGHGGAHRPLMPSTMSVTAPTQFQTARQCRTIMLRW